MKNLTFYQPPLFNTLTVRRKNFERQSKFSAFRNLVTLLTFMVTVLCSFSAKGQSVTCWFDEMYDSLMVNSPQMEAVYEYNEFLMAHMLAENPSAITECEVYTIPVVVHVIHLGESVGTGTNISNAQIQSAIDDLNDQFRNEHEMSTDICIQFCLAVRDPDGVLTTGINRVNGYDVCVNSLCYQNVGITSDNEVTIKNLSRWPNKDYYNIWVVSEINGNNGGAGVQGYAYLPGTTDNKDGTVILYNAFGTTGTLKSYTDQNKVLVHETGHFLFTYHTFEGDVEGTSCPPNTDCQVDGDHICDTPPHIRSNSDCNDMGTNSCDGGAPNEKYVHNYMDYSDEDCRYQFTNGQRTKMRCALLASRFGLTYSLGCSPACTTVVASYTGGNGLLDYGDNVTYTNTSTNGDTYVWRLNGINISTTTNLNYTFTAGGTYTLCLDATNEDCTNRYCTQFLVVPNCRPPVNECEKVENGNFEQISANPASSPNDFSIVCGWKDTYSSPFFCAQPENNAIGLYFRDTHNNVDLERITSILPLDLVENRECELSFDYYSARAPVESIIIALTEDNTPGLLPMDATIIAEISNPDYDPTLVHNNKCYPEEAEFQHYYDGSFAYNGDGNLYLNITGTAPATNTTYSLVFVDNLSISCCLPNCQPEPDFTFSIDSCEVTFYGVNTGDEGDFFWDFGDGTTGSGDEVTHNYLWPGVYNVCLIIECEEFGAATICKEVEIPAYCDFCEQLPPVIARRCDGEDDTTKIYMAELSFEIPSGYLPCDSSFFVWSDEVTAVVNSFNIDSFDITTDVVTVSYYLFPPEIFDFDADSAYLYMTFCDTSGAMICFKVAIIGKACDFCFELEEPVIASCDTTLSDMTTFVYEGTFVLDVDFPLDFIESISPNVGFVIESYSQVSSTEWSFDFSITTQDLNFTGTSAMFIFFRQNTKKWYCYNIPFVIDTACPSIPVQCKSNWYKTLLCSYLDEEGLIVFPTGLMSIPVPEGYEICDNGPIVFIDDPYELVVNSVEIIDSFLWFDIEIHADRDSSGREAHVRFLFCDDRGDTMICQGVWFKLKCNLVLPRSERHVFKHEQNNDNDLMRVMPNPVSDLLYVQLMERKLDELSVTLADLSGRKIFQNRIPPENDQTNFDVSGIAEGVYFLIVTDANRVMETKKIVVIH